jgi:hypothetical protein
MGATNVFTYVLTDGSLTISSSQNVVRLTVLCKAGTLSFLGTSSFNGLTSVANGLSAGQGVTLSAISVSQPLDGITISAPTSLDVTEVMLSFG